MGGNGALLTDADGDQYIDGLAGLWNVTVGHGRTELADAAREQMATLAFASAYAGSTNPRAIELAERLAAICYPSINRFFFTCGGAEANETAIKIARSVLEAAGTTSQDESDLPGARLSRRDARRDERHWHRRLLAPVRTSCPAVRAHPVAVPVPVSGSAWSQSGRGGG